MELTPAQERVVSGLMGRGQPRPTFAASLSVELKAALEQEVGPLVGLLPKPPLFVSKHALATVHACESNHLAEQGWDGWSIARAEGEVTHRAIRLSIGTGDDRPPLELVDHALTALESDELNSLGTFVGDLPGLARADLRARAANSVTTFQECWPPLPASWRPRTELPVDAGLCDDSVRLRGKVDLVLGVAAGLEARCLFVDLKTGGHYPAHLDDLRFYALVQTLRVGVPPFRVASYYLDSAAFVAEDVTEETLEIAVRRTIDGIRKMIELQAELRPPAVTPCPRCRYCRIRSTCEGARQWEAAISD